ncbi:MAG: hypothetical protein M1816_003041 [Peltula sp. TS41687]|nr:MAG: hypothetical protein M1816_003041 [Peltula sp. TS41687]
MPRVANHPRANARGTSVQTSATTPFKTPLRMPLNDDAQEKAARLQSRQALHDIQLNQIRAAASPMRKLSNFNRAGSSSPQSSSQNENGSRRRDEQSGGGLVVAGNMVSVSPVKRVPILANFEEWMKMATDNKINATNSWNFALIDYFHDMSLLKEGDGVNFQKASCTLDGCVKIYTNRVDSVATETGKLLSGLTESDSKKRRKDDEGGADGAQEGEEGEEGEEEGDDGTRRRVKKRTQRSSEATLASSFAQLQLKKFDLEFAVDPLFKKASADFDEGGAKGLLLNNLAIDAQGRIIFDSSDDAEDDGAEHVPDESTAVPGKEYDTATEEDIRLDEHGNRTRVADIDLLSLKDRFFPDLDILDSQDICPSLKNSNLADPTGALDVPFLKAPSDWRQEQNQPANLPLDEENGAGFDDDEDDALGGFELPPDTGLGEGGEVWAKNAAVELQVPVQSDGHDKDGQEEGGDAFGVGEYDAQGGEYVVSLSRGGVNDDHDGILIYFDDALRKNWAGPEHWRIRRIKDSTKSTAPAPRARKEKEPFEIDFLGPLDAKLAEAISTPATSASSITLPKTQWRSKTRNLLPDDKHFNSKQLIRLFLKPRARLGSRRKFSRQLHPSSRSDDRGVLEEEMDEAFWARDGVPPPAGVGEDGAVQGNYDANFFQDDGLAFPNGLPDDDEDEFADARETFSNGDGQLGGGEEMLLGAPPASSQDGGYGTQLVTQSRRLRPEYVQYARVAKKVDVRRLKEEMWKGMGLQIVDSMNADPIIRQQVPTPAATPVPEDDDRGSGSLKFTEVINNLQSVYPEQAMADISTSYCFICLLHLANEKGLEIAGDKNLMELQIRRDFTAEVTGEEA